MSAVKHKEPFAWSMGHGMHGVRHDCYSRILFLLLGDFRLAYPGLRVMDSSQFSRDMRIENWFLSMGNGGVKAGAFNEGCGF